MPIKPPVLPNTKTILPRRLVSGAHTRTDSQGVQAGSTVPRTRSRYYNEPLSNVRAMQKPEEALRELSHIDGTLSAAVFNIVQVAKSGAKLAVYDSVTHQFSPEGAMLAASIKASLNTLYDYSEGYSVRQGVTSVEETLLREAALCGGVALELVLDKGRFPDRLLPVNVNTLDWVSDGKNGKYPQQQSTTGEAVNLNIPTFWVAYVHEEPNMTYPRSMFEAGLAHTFRYGEFIEDIVRVVKRSGHTRLVVKLDSAKIKATADRKTQNDPVKLQAYFDAVRTAIDEQLKAVEPDDAIITYDMAVPEHLQSSLGSRSDYSPMLSTMSGMYSTALKAPPSILGLRLEGGSQALGNVESLTFLKTAQAIQVPVAIVLSRAFTLACRLYGLDVYCEYIFNPIDLRPETELEAFKTMRENTILQRLSLGFITDDEAAFWLGTGPRAPGAPLLSGTLFMHRQTGADPVDMVNPADSAMGRTLQPSQELPRSGGGRDNTKRVS